MIARDATRRAACVYRPRCDLSAAVYRRVRALGAELCGCRYLEVSDYTTGSFQGRSSRIKPRSGVALRLTGLRTSARGEAVGTPRGAGRFELANDATPAGISPARTTRANRDGTGSRLWGRRS